jgi:hypothetical protein
MKTETLLLLLVAAAVGVYFVTRSKTTAVTYPPGMTPYGTQPVYNPYLQQQNTTAQDITAAGVAAGGIADIISAFQSGGDNS